MIDTDKYEGHSEGEWKVGARKGAMTVRDSNGEEIAATNSYSNARIMADAPLLLAEVERLRGVLLRIIDTAKGKPFISGHINSIVAEVFKELI
jgi:hypothetical protein